MSNKVLLRELNPHITCTLCNGYFVDPVTVSECLHSFCKSCVVKHLETSKKCPICEREIHKSRPLLCIRPDKKLQDIVYKLVPGLHEDEMRRRKLFYSKNPPTGESLKAYKEERDKIFFCEYDKISLSIQYFEPAATREASKTKDNRNLRYLRCPGMLKIKHLKKFVANKYGLNSQFVVDIIYSDDLIPENFTLIDVAYQYNWRKDKPMELYYRIFKMNNVILRRKKKHAEIAKSDERDESEDSHQSKKPKLEKNSYKSNLESEQRKSQQQQPQQQSLQKSVGSESKNKVGSSAAAEKSNNVKSAPINVNGAKSPKKDIEKKLESLTQKPTAAEKKPEVVELSVHVSASDVKEVVKKIQERKASEASEVVKRPALTSQSPIASANNKAKLTTPSSSSPNSLKACHNGEKNILSAIVQNLKAKKQQEEKKNVGEKSSPISTHASQLTKGIPASTTVTVKMVDGKPKQQQQQQQQQPQLKPQQPENRKILPVPPKSVVSSTPGNNPPPPPSFIKLNKSPPPKKEVFVTSSNAPSSVTHRAAGMFTTPPFKPSLTSKPNTNALVAAAAANNSSSPFMQNSNSKLPNNRLQLKVPQSSIPLLKLQQHQQQHQQQQQAAAAAAMAAMATNPSHPLLAQSQAASLFLKQAAASDFLWGTNGAMAAAAAAAAAVTSAGKLPLPTSTATTAGASVGSYPKALNQSLRQIPNPSLLTKNQSSILPK